MRKVAKGGIWLSVGDRDCSQFPCESEESCLLSALSLLLMQELEGDEEAEDDDDAEINPKVSCRESPHLCLRYC